MSLVSKQKVIMMLMLGRFLSAADYKSVTWKTFKTSHALLASSLEDHSLLAAPINYCEKSKVIARIVELCFTSE